MNIQCENNTFDDKTMLGMLEKHAQGFKHSKRQINKIPTIEHIYD